MRFPTRTFWAQFCLIEKKGEVGNPLRWHPKCQTCDVPQAPESLARVVYCCAGDSRTCFYRCK